MRPSAHAVHDPRIKERHLKAAIHDYYFARSLRLVKPGGIITFITSRYTLDKVNPRVRRHIAEHAELLAVARLPENAFRKNAGTEVVTDVLILRRKASPSGVDNKLAWIETDALANAEEYRVPVNRLYIERPELMLGVPGCSRGMYGDHEFTLKPDGRDLAAALRDSLISQLPFQAITATMVNQSTSAPLPAEDAQEKEKADAVDLDRLSGISRQRASLLLDIYSAAKQVIKLQLLDAEDEKLIEAQRELNSLYLRFTARYGPVNAKQNLRDLDGRSPLVPFLRALEEPAGKGSWKRAAIFHSRTIRPRKDFAQISSPKDALFFCLNECGRVDLDRIAVMTGQTKEEAVGALRGLIFETTSGDWATADEYLSGNVVEKLKEAQAAAALNPRFQENVEALTAVQPTPLGTEEIAARLGSGWIPPSVVRQFIREIVPQFDGQVKYVESLGVWKIEGSNYWARYSIEATQTWGTARMNAIDLLDDGLNLRTPMIYDEIDEPAGTRRVLNDTETVAAQAKLAEIKMKFVEWLWSSEARARELCAIYNERYNCLRERRYDGSHLQLPGMNSSITLRPHQLDGIARILQSKATLLGHCVGAGKTFLMVAAAMELKRLGLCHKTMAVVPNHLPAQWEAEARRLYADINVLAPSKEDLSASQRGELLSRISTGSWDLIIVPHTAFKMLPVAPDTIARYIQREIDVLREYLESIPKDERGDNRKTIKEIERAIKKLEVKLKDCESAILRDSKHTITWEELGVDGLFVDECFPYEARILTDQGELQIGEIVEKRLKVKALSCDTATGTMEWKPVIGWSAKRLGKRLVRVNHEGGSFICTEDHKIWTVEAGYVKAIELKSDQTLRTVRRGTVSGAGEEEQGVLQSQVRGASTVRHSLYHHCLSGMPEGICPATTKRNEKILLTELRSESVTEAGGNEGLRVVWSSVHKESLEQQGQGSAVLRLRVCGEVATQQARGEGAIQETYGSVLRTAQRLQIAGSIGADEEEQPDERSRRGRKDAPKAGRSYLFVQGRQSDSDHTPGFARRKTRPAGGVCDLDGTRERSISVAAPCLQSGYCGPVENAGHRGRRQFTQAEEMEVFGPAQGIRLECSRVVGVEVLEQGSAGGLGGSGGENRIVYDLEVADNHNFFAEGVLVSNCHLYKNLYCPTKMRNVAGLPTADSQRAFDAFIKVRSLLDGGGRVVFATATPVSNTLAEVYVMMKFLQLDTLEEMGIAHFDAWTQLFAETSQGLEMKPDCSGFRVNTRFCKFTNLPELAALWRQALDVKNADQLNLPRPRIAGGAPQVITIPASPELKRFVKNLAARVEAIKSRRVSPEADNMLKITTEGRKAALDIRLVMPDAPRPAYSKIEAVADKIAEFYKQSQHLRGAQAIFSDLGVPVRRR
jgi:N12 class adenine-specific DNA methylase